MNYTGSTTISPWLTTTTANSFLNRSIAGSSNTSNNLTLTNNSNAVYTTASTVTEENINGKTEN